MIKPIHIYLFWLYGICIAASLLAFSPVLVAADIYVYVDNQGIMHFTNVPATSEYEVYIKGRPKRSRGKVDTNRYDRYINEAAGFHGVDFPLIKAVIRAESAFNPKAVSKKGALGLMQIMPDNLEAFRVYDPFDPWQNIMGGSRYLKKLIQRFDGKLKLALAAYNAGPTAVDNYSGIPPYPETKAYVKKVLKFFEFYKNS